MFTTPDGPDAVRAAVEATLQRNEDHHRSSALPKLGLPTSWVGERQTGASSVHRSFSHSNDELDRSTATPDRQSETVELIHGSYPGGPWLAVAASNAPDDEFQPSLVAILRDEIQAVMPTASEPHPQGEYPVKKTTVYVRIDDEMVVLKGATYAGLTVARAALDGWTLTLKARDWPHDEPIELTRLDDVEPYLSGRRQAIHKAMDL
jgi:hypothetical protein